MGILTLTPRLLTVALIAVLSVFLATAMVTIVGRFMTDLFERFGARNIVADEARIFQFIECGDPQLSKEMTRTVELRDHIVKLGRGVSGDLLTKLMLLYTSLGFTRGDFRAMAGGRRHSRLLALERCRALSIPLPEEAWPILLSDTLPSARWAAMEYLVAIKGRAALPWVLHYIVQETSKSTARKGILIHVVSCLAQHTPEILPHLLDHLDRDVHREILLLVLAMYPSPGAERMIVRALRANASVSLLLAGVQALASHPSHVSLGAMSTLVEHNDSRIRQAVAEAIYRFGDSAAAGLLAQLAVDSSYQVRLAAVSSLVAVQALDEIEVIAKDPLHPGHLMWRRFALSSESKEVA